MESPQENHSRLPELAVCWIGAAFNSRVRARLSPPLMPSQALPRACHHTGQRLEHVSHPLSGSCLLSYSAFVENAAFVGRSQPCDTLRRIRQFVVPLDWLPRDLQRTEARNFLRAFRQCVSHGRDRGLDSFLWFAEGQR